MARYYVNDALATITYNSKICELWKHGSIDDPSEQSRCCGAHLVQTGRAVLVLSSAQGEAEIFGRSGVGVPRRRTQRLLSECAIAAEVQSMSRAWPAHCLVCVVGVSLRALPRQNGVCG